MGQLQDSENEGTRPWGRYLILEEGSGYKVKRIEVKPGLRLSLQSHRRRQEQWTVVQGEALVTLGADLHPLGPGESIQIPRETPHRVANPGPALLVFIEVQTGDYLGEDDITRYEDDFHRV
jgi:mannose-6-phosphate isomerase-like protein (cupin superfamily)